MEFANKIEGAVFFVDLLGIGALTQDGLTLDECHYSEWLDQYKVKYSDQYLATALLSEFRNVLMGLSREYSNVKLAQLSDCAFIWSENITEVILFANNLMTQAIKKGLLCRAGLAYGEIIDTGENENHKLGKFIVGSAVSRAVKLEGMSKGARVLIDEDFPSHFYEYDQNFSRTIKGMFASFKNNLDYTIYDEFKWYLIPNLTKNMINYSAISDLEKVSFVQKRLELAAHVRFSPKYNWNVSSKQGIIQVKATIDLLTAQDFSIFNIWHNFRWKADEIETIEKLEDREERSYSKLERVKEKILEKEHYKSIKYKQTKKKIIQKFKGECNKFCVNTS